MTYRSLRAGGLSMSDFVSGEDIEAFCGDCPNRKVKTSLHSGRAYDFCKSFQSPVFKVIDLCQQSPSCSALRPSKRFIQTKFSSEA
jgi:hypothetical protein